MSFRHISFRRPNDIDVFVETARGLTSAAVQAGGTGYQVGDRLILLGGTFEMEAVVKVATLAGSAVATVTVDHKGAYTAAPTDPVATSAISGTGTGATFNLTVGAAGSLIPAAANIQLIMREPDGPWHLFFWEA